MKHGHTAAGCVARVALAAASLLFWLSLGVAVIGKAADPANLVYLGVLGVGITGALIARFRPRRMARFWLVTALAQALVLGIALTAGLGSPWNGPIEILVLNGLFAALFAGSAWLFRRAARGQLEPVPATRRRWPVVLLGLGAALAMFLGVKWKSLTVSGGQQPAEPFRIAGNLYYVGANDVTSFLITGPEGHVLIDGGYPGTPPLILDSIARLGFDIRDVEVLLNSEPHYDHAGGLAALQEASGAELWLSEASADAIAAGGADPGAFLPYRLLVWSGILRYPIPRIDHRFEDGATIRLGPIELTAHVTGGHTRGCTSWSFPVRHGDRELHAVSACSLLLLPGMSLVEPQRYPGIRDDFERAFPLLRSLPVDIFLTTHARQFGRYRKFRQQADAEDPADPFIDREGYLSYIDTAEARFREALADQQRRR